MGVVGLRVVVGPEALGSGHKGEGEGEASANGVQCAVRTSLQTNAVCTIL